jgi:hypothetical protein
LQQEAAASIQSHASFFAQQQQQQQQQSLLPPAAATLLAAAQSQEAALVARLAVQEAALMQQRRLFAGHAEEESLQDVRALHASDQLVGSFITLYRGVQAECMVSHCWPFNVGVLLRKFNTTEGLCPASLIASA